MVVVVVDGGSCVVGATLVSLGFSEPGVPSVGEHETASSAARHVIVAALRTFMVPALRGGQASPSLLRNASLDGSRWRNASR